MQVLAKWYARSVSILGHDFLKHWQDFFNSSNTGLLKKWMKYFSDKNKDKIFDNCCMAIAVWHNCTQH